MFGHMCCFLKLLVKPFQLQQLWSLNWSNRSPDSPLLCVQGIVIKKKQLAACKGCAQLRDMCGLNALQVCRDGASDKQPVETALSRDLTLLNTDVMLHAWTRTSNCL